MRLLFALLFLSYNLLSAQQGQIDSLLKKYEYFHTSTIETSLDSQFYLSNTVFFYLFEEENYLINPPASPNLRVLCVPTNSEPFLLHFELNSTIPELIIKQAVYEKFDIDDFDKTKFTRKEWNSAKRDFDNYNFETLPVELIPKAYKDSIKFQYKTFRKGLQTEEIEKLQSILGNPSCFVARSEANKLSTTKWLENGTYKSYCVGVSLCLEYLNEHHQQFTTVTHRSSKELWTFIDTKIQELAENRFINEINSRK